MLEALFVVQVLSTGLALEPPSACVDAPPATWSLEEIPVLDGDVLTGWASRVQVAALGDGTLIVVEGGPAGARIAESTGGPWSLDFEQASEVRDVRLVTDGDAVRAAFCGPAGASVATRGTSGWSTAPSTPLGTGGAGACGKAWALASDGSVRSASAGPLNEAIVLTDSAALTPELVPLPDIGAFGVTSLVLVALQVSPTGATHLLFARQHRSRLEYATNASGAWTFSTVEPLEFNDWWLFRADLEDTPWVHPGRPVRLVDLAVNAAGAAHVAYRRTPSFTLGYATDQSGAWERVLVDHGAPTGQQPALAFSASGAPWMTYQAVARGALRLAVQTPEGWSTSTVDARATAGASSALAPGPDGRWHVVYTQDGANGVPATAARPLQHATSSPCTLLPSEPARRRLP